jgi:peptidoglycan/LPS O-acetylase OafA/YrhL
MDADGFALLFWAGVAGLVIVVAAGGVEWLLSRPSRRWIRRLQRIQAGRARQEAEFIASNCFKDWRPR